MEIIGYFLAALVGISLGLIGGGGSILMVPILVYVFGLNPVTATSYSLFIVGSTSLVGAFNNYRKGQVSIQTALLFGLSSISTVFITRKLLMPAVPDVLGTIGRMEIKKPMVIMVLFAVLMLMASVAMIRSKKDAESTENQQQKPAIGKLLLYGILIGLATGFLGAGGGFLIIPALVLLLNMPMKKAIGTSLLIIALNSLIGFTGDIGQIDIRWSFLLLVAAIAITGIFIGGALAKKIPGAKLKHAFGWFVLVMGIYIFLKELFFRS